MKRDGRVLLKCWSMWMHLGLFSRVSAPSYSYHPVHFLGLGTISCGLPLYGPLPSGIVVSTVMWCPILWGNSRHSYVCSATDTASIWIVSGSPLGRVTSGLVGLVGTSQIGIAPTVPLADVAEARGRTVGAGTIHWGFSPESCAASCSNLPCLSPHWLSFPTLS